MKKLITILFALPYVIAFGQVQKYRAYEVDIEILNGEILKPSITKGCNLLVVVNFTAEKFKVFTPEIQDFDVIAYGKKMNLMGSSGTINSYTCVDQTGKQCVVCYGLYKYGDYRASLSIRYIDAFYTYHLRKSD